MSHPYHSLSPFELWLDDMSDRLNPYVVRDVRMWLKSRWLPIVLAMQLAITWYVTVEIVSGAESVTDAAGRHLFAVLSRMAILTTTIPIPLYLGLSLAQEVRGDCLETLWLTPDSRRHFVAGKLLTSFLSYTLHLSVFVPFMTVAMLLGGVGVIDVLLFLLANTLVMLILCFCALVLGACAHNRFIIAFMLSVIGLPMFWLIALLWSVGTEPQVIGILLVLLIIAGPILGSLGLAKCSPPVSHLAWHLRVPVREGLQSSLNLTPRTRFTIVDKSI